MRRTLATCLAVVSWWALSGDCRVTAQVLNAEPDLKVLHVDSFQQDKLAQYATGDDVVWTKGQLTLPPGGYIRRDVAAERHIRVTVDVDWTDESGNDEKRDSWFTCGFGFRTGGTLLMRIARSRKSLRVTERPGNIEPGGLHTDTWSVSLTRNVREKPAEDQDAKWVRKRAGEFKFTSAAKGPWTFSLQHGLVRLSDGTAVVMRHHVSRTEGDIRRVVLWSEKDTAFIRDLQISGTPHVELTLLQRPSGEKRTELGKQLTQLRENKEYTKSIPLRKESLTLTELIYGADNYRFAQELQSLSVLYYRVGNHKQDLEVSQRRLEVCERVYGDDHPRTANALSDLAYAWRKAADFRSEEAVLRRAMEIRRETLGKDDEKYTEARQRLKNVLPIVAQHAESNDDFEAAHQRRAEVLEIVTEEKGRLHWSTSEARVAINDLARRRGLSGERRHQLRWARQSEAESEKHFSKKEYDKAIAAREKALDVRKELLGERHREYARSLTLLAVLYARKGQYARAELLSRKSLEVYTVLFGEDHPDVAQAHSNLGHLSGELQNHTRSVESYRQAIAAYRRLFGEEDKRFINARVKLADALMSLRNELTRLGRFTDALKVAEELIAIDEQRFENAPLPAFNSRWQLNRIKQLAKLNKADWQRLAAAERLSDKTVPGQSRDRDEAVARLKTAITVTREILGEHSGEYRDLLARLSSAHVRRKEYDAAIDILQMVAVYDQSLFSELDGRHQKRALAINDLGLALESTGRLEEAIPLLRESINVFTQTDGPDSRNTRIVSISGARVLGKLARQTESEGRFEAALELRRETVDLETRIRGEQDWRTSDAHRDLALTELLASSDVASQQSFNAAARLAGDGYEQFDQAEYAQAVESLTESLEIYVEVLGDDHWKCADVLIRLGDASDAVGETSASLQHYKSALQIRIGALPELHPDTADASERIGYLLATGGESKAALPFLKQTLNIRMQLFGKEHESVQSSSRVLDTVQEISDGNDEAEPPAAFVLHLMANTADHLRTMIAEAVSSGDFAQAATYEARLLPIHRRVLGPDHRRNAESLAAIVEYQLAGGDLSAAIETAQTAIDHCEEQHGEEHWRTVSARVSFDELNRIEALSDDERKQLEESGRLSRQVNTNGGEGRAVDLDDLEQAIKLRRSLLGRLDSTAAAIQLEVIRIRSKADSPDQAAVRSDFEQLIDVQTEMLDTTHPAVAEVRRAFGEWLYSLDKFSDAREQFQQAVEIAESAHGPDAIETADELFFLADALKGLRDYPTADALSVRSATVRLKLLAEDDLRVTASLTQLVEIRLASDSPGGARNAASKAVELWQHHPDDTLGKAIALSNLGIVHARLGELDEAKLTLTESLETFRRLDAIDSSDAARATTGLGIYHSQRQEIEQAINWLRQARRASLQLSKDHWLRRLTTHNLQELLDGTAREHLKNKQLAEAEAQFIEVVALRRELFAENHGQVRSAQVDLDTIIKRRKLSTSELEQLSEPSATLKRMSNMFHSGEREAALELAQKTLAAHRKLLGNDCRDTSLIIFGLAKLKLMSEQLEEAEQLFQECLAIYADVVGNDQLDYAVMVGMVAQAYKSESQLKQAVAAYRQSLDVLQQIPGQEGAETIPWGQGKLADAVSALSQEARSLGEIETAAQLAAEAYALNLAARGADHWQTIDARFSVSELKQIASLSEDDRDRLAEANKLQAEIDKLRESNRLSDAVPMAESRVKMMRGIFGSSHTLVAKELLNTGRLHRRLEHWPQAQQCFDEALTISKTQLGADNPQTATSQQLLSLSWMGLGNYEKARETGEEALSIRRRQLGSNHYDTTTSLNNLALVLEELGDFTGARKFYEEVIATRSAAYGGAQSSQLALPLMNLGMLESRQGNSARARTLLEQALTVYRKHDGDNHRDTIHCMILLAQVCRDSDDVSAAMPLLQEALKTAGKNTGNFRGQMADAHFQLGITYRLQSNNDLARTHLEQALDLSVELFGPASRMGARCQSNLAWLAFDTGDHENARKLSENALAIMREVYGDDHAETAWIVASAGDQHRLLSDYKAARKSYLEALAIDRKYWGPDHARTTTRMTQVARHFQRMGFYSESQNLFAEALRITRTTQPTESVELADVLTDYGDSLSRMGNVVAAKDCLEEALAINRKVRGDADPSTALVCRHLSLLHDAVGQRKQYNAYCREALSIAERAWGPDHLNVTPYLNNLAGGLERDEPEQARKLRERALAILQTVRSDEASSSVELLLSVAEQMTRLDRHAESFEYYAQALQKRRSFGESNVDVADILRNMAKVRNAQNQHEPSRDLFQQAQEMLDKHQGTEHEASCRNRIDLAEQHLRLDNSEVGLVLLENAFNGLRSTWGKDHPKLAERLTEAVLMLLNTGHPQQGVTYAHEALRIREATLDSQHPDVSDSYTLLGQALGNARDYEQAWKYMMTSARMRARQVSQGLTAESEQQHAQRIGFRRHVLEAMFSLADLAPEFAATQAEDLLSVVLDWKSMSSRSLLARQEALMLERDPQAVRSYDDLRDVRQRLTQLKLYSGSRGPDSNLATLTKRRDELERELAERVQGYATLRNSSEAGPDAIGRHMPPNSVLVEFTRYRPYRFDDTEKVVWGNPRYAAIIYQPLARKTWLTDFERAQAESKRLGKPLLLHFVSGWDPYTRKMDADVIYEPEFQQMLDQFVAVRVDVGNFNQNLDLGKQFKIKGVPTDILISPTGKELGRIGGFQDKATYIKAITETFKVSPQGGGPRLILLGDAKPIEDAIHNWRRSVQTRRVDTAAEQELYERVWQPIEESLFRDASRVFIAPDGELALIPFEAIRLTDKRYLVEQYHVSYLSNGRELMPRLTPPGEPGPAVVVSDPAYDFIDTGNDQPTGTLLASVDQTRSQAMETRGLSFQSLPGFSREAQAVSAAWKNSGTSDPLTLIEGNAAEEEALFQLNRPRFLHLVTHGFFFPDLNTFRGLSSEGSVFNSARGPGSDPENRGLAKVRRKQVTAQSGPAEDARLRSGLALAGANQWLQRNRAGRSDGLLTALEVENLNLWGTELVVLSACETGLGEVQVGEGVMGLRRAFQQAGARTVMSSLWKVPDAETERLMTRFFQLWLTGSDKSAALRSAQLELITRLKTEPDSNRRESPPFYWAAFICHGVP